MKKILILSAFILLSFFAFCQQPFYRYYNSRMKKHYYTTNFSEFRNGWKDWALEGPACLVFNQGDRRDGLVPLLRYNNPSTGDHYYTIHRHELGDRAEGYNYEGIACFIYKFQVNGTVPLYSYYNQRIGDHFLTADRRELGRGFEGYQLETITGYVMPGRREFR